MMLWKRSLTARLLTLFLLLTIVPLGVVGYLTYDRGRQTLVADVKAHLESVAILKEQEIHNWVQHLEHTTQWLSTSPQTRDAAAALVSHAPGDPAYESARDTLVTELRRVTDLGHLKPLSLLDADNGHILASSQTVWEGQSRWGEAWFSRGREGVTVSDMVHSLTLGRTTLVIASPVTDDDGQLLGVLAGHANLGDLNAIMMERSGLGETGETYLVDGDHLLLTASRFKPDSAFRRRIFTTGVDRALAREPGVALYRDYRGAPVIGAYRWLDDMNVALLAEIDQSEALGPVAALRNTVVGIGLGVGLVVTLLGLLVSRTITRPLQRLVEGTGEVGRGNLAYRWEVRKEDEVGQLARALNQMTADLQAVTASRDELNREIAERKRAEAALRRHQEQLEERVAERTAELREAQEQMLHQERLAALGQFSGSIAHELRNPMGAIKNAAFFLGMAVDDPDPDVEEALEILEREVERSDAIIKALLDFVRQPSPTSEALAVNEVLRRALSHVDVPTDIDVELRLDEGLPLIKGDSNQIEQIFVNLVHNAVQAMPQGGRLTVVSEQDAGMGEDDARDRVGTGEWIQVVVRDTGVGIPEEHLDRVFEPLFSTKTQGIGLGLSIVETLVEGHGGTVQVESEPGRGSTFTVRLPVQQAVG